MACRYKIGDKIKVVANSNAHNYAKDRVYEIVCCFDANEYSEYIARDEFGWEGNYLSQFDIIGICKLKNSIQD